MIGQDRWRTGSSTTQLRRGSRSILEPHPRMSSFSPLLLLHQQNFLVSSEFSSPLFVRSLWLYILLLPSSWLSICRLRRSPLECLSHPALLSTCCKLQWAAWHCLGVIPSLMRPDCQLQAFNVEVTGSSTIALSPCSHSYPSTLVPSFGDDGEGCGGWRIILSSQDTSCQGHDVPRRFLLVALGLSQPSSDVFLLGWALGLIIQNGPRHPDPLAPQ